MKKNKGFTLVELMIVVAIIGLLAAIAIPNLLRARVNSNDQAIRGDMRTFSTASESFRAAQTPTPAYPAAMENLTAGDPPYLDSTWSVNGVTKHGHALTYTTAAGIYALFAESLPGQSSARYCIDETGTLLVGSTGSSSGNCTGSGTAV